MDLVAHPLSTALYGALLGAVGGYYTNAAAQHRATRRTHQETARALTAAATALLKAVAAREAARAAAVEHGESTSYYRLYPDLGEERHLQALLRCVDQASAISDRCRQTWEKAHAVVQRLQRCHVDCIQLAKLSQTAKLRERAATLLADLAEARTSLLAALNEARPLAARDTRATIDDLQKGYGDGNR